MNRSRSALAFLATVALLPLGSCCLFCTDPYEPTASMAVAETELLFRFEPESQARYDGMSELDKRRALVSIWRHADEVLPAEIFSRLGRSTLPTDPDGWVTKATLDRAAQAAQEPLFRPDGPDGPEVAPPLCEYDKLRKPATILCGRVQNTVRVVEGLRFRFGVRVHVRHKMPVIP